MLEAEASEPYMCDNFNYVESDIKLEQSIQRASKTQTLMFAVVAEFELISHEILIIQNNCRKLTDERMMEHHKTYTRNSGALRPLFLMPTSPVFLTMCVL